MVIAVIIARGGSIRLPRKNLRLFCGIPLVAWSIIQAQCSHLVDEVFVSTDDDEIETVSLTYGARVIRRPDWPDADQASANRPYNHAIDVLEAGYGLDYAMVQILPTSPLRFPDDIDRGIRKYRELGTHRVLPMARRRETFLYREVHPDMVRFTFGDKDRKFFDQAGCFNVCNPAWYRTFTTAYSDLDADINAQMANPETDYAEVDFYYVETQPFQMAEVDTYQEWELAEVLMRHYIIGLDGTQIYHEYEGMKDDEQRKPNPQQLQRIQRRYETTPAHPRDI